MAFTEKVWFSPSHLVAPAGWVVIEGGLLHCALAVLKVLRTENKVTDIESSRYLKFVFLWLDQVIVRFISGLVFPQRNAI